MGNRLVYFSYEKLIVNKCMQAQPIVQIYF